MACFKNKTMKKAITTYLFMFLTLFAIAQELKNPSFEEVISLQSVYNAVISPDGKHVVFVFTSTDWKDNRYDRQLWLSKNGEEPFQLTNNLKNNSNNPKWSPDGKWISFISNRDDKNQLHVIRVAGGEAFQITNSETGISNYEWSPDGSQIAFTQSEDKSDIDDKRKKKYGSYAVDDEEYSLRQLFVMDFDEAELNRKLNPQQLEDSVFKASQKPTLLMDSVDFTIGNFKWSPDGEMIAFNQQPDPLINSFFKSDISIYDFNSESYRELVSNPSSDGFADWSPDGKSILYYSNVNDTTSNYYLNNRMFSIGIDGKNKKELATAFDENISQLRWNALGIYGVAWEKTKRTIVKIDPESGNVTKIPTEQDRIYGISFSKDESRLAYLGSTDNSFNEIFISDTDLESPTQLTNLTAQIDGWASLDSEVISWKSEDGATIEGVLHKPKDYDPKRKYPLLVAIHGGPTGISTPTPVYSSVYPVIQWVNKGALVLRPNYRGSAGYGEEFRSLNVKNLGVGDAWDVLSGIEYLEDQGLIDGDSLGCMGWSQGGYISAFLTTNSKKFKAISVGAGISNWMTYYVNTDIHPFTRQYLKDTPWSNKQIYELTSPMTNINNASTPTLIQHGEFDRRVPIANGYELVQGLRDVGVETELIVYKGFGHGISKPKERLAAIWHNWQWFAKYIWGEEIELPEN
jgi:dipeptidyl aminopeptidase/acylaminoacyl peptidase